MKTIFFLMVFSALLRAESAPQPVPPPQGAVRIDSNLLNDSFFEPPTPKQIRENRALQSDYNDVKDVPSRPNGPAPFQGTNQ